jgi:hypothetical protein
MIRVSKKTRYRGKKKKKKGKTKTKTKPKKEMIKQENNRNMYGSLNKQAFTIVSLLIFKVDE